MGRGSKKFDDGVQGEPELYKYILISENVLNLSRLAPVTHPTLVGTLIVSFISISPLVCPANILPLLTSTASAGLWAAPIAAEPLGISLPPLTPSIPSATEPLASKAHPLPILQLPTPPLESPPFPASNIKPKRLVASGQALATTLTRTPWHCQLG